MLSFLIITFGNNYLRQCIDSIRKFYKNITICIVDNKLNSIVTLDEYKNIRYSKNNGNYFELGSIWFAIKKWKDISKFIIFQNSFLLLNKIPDNIINKNYVPFWKENASAYSPVIKLFEKKLNEIGIDIKTDKSWKSVCCCCCIIEIAILHKLIDKGFDKIYAKKKIEAVSTEVIFGFIMHSYLNMDYEPLYKYPISSYYSKKNKEWTYIKKIASGQGISNCNSNYYFDIKTLPYDIKNRFNNKNELFIYLLKYINKNESLIKILIDSFPSDIITNNTMLSNVLSSIRHRMFTKKYFNDTYKKEYEDIVNHRIKIF